MAPTIALLICVAFVFLLLSIERKHNHVASTALWIPTVWMLICGSRPVGAWFQGRTTGPLTPELIEAGSLPDRLALTALILFALFVLYKRKIDWPLLFKNNSSLVFLFIFSGLSILWSDFPFLSLKRWIRLTGIIPVALIILSELNPREALVSIFRRCAYMLIPISLVLIKYYPRYGRQYGRWTGTVSWSGVTILKNSLGQLCMFLAIFLIWEFLRESRAKRFSRTGPLYAADGLVLVLSIFLLVKSGSITSIIALIVSIVSMFFLYRTKNRSRYAATLVIYAIVFTWVILIIGAPIVGEATRFMGRDSSFTGRTSFWPVLFEAGARHPLFGAGFGGYFGTPGNELFALTGYVVGHNGLLDVYVELGIAGLILLLSYHLVFFRRFRQELNRAFDWGVFGICFLVLSWVCNFSESLFLKSTSLIWSVTILFSVVFSIPHLNGERSAKK